MAAGRSTRSAASIRTRRAAYGLLVRARSWEVFRCLVSELEDGWHWGEPCPDAEFERVARWLTELGDRRAVGHVLAVFEQATLRPGAEAAVAVAFAPSGWWAEIEGARRRIERGEPVLLSSADEKEIEAPDGYHESLDWMRPVEVGPDDDLSHPGAEWLTTRGPDGRIPLVELLAERARTSPHQGFAAWDRRRQLDDLAIDAHESLASGQRAEARRLVEAILEAEPANPFGLRLKRRLRMD